ncbi:MAG: N-acetylmuramic acid 6-phosphate etherase [Candidatus Hydrogenedentes bacterium]|nr:N-acetylmuramic acid 6-phosphate etherase [Candidatus Hydrogenedentota bacterium]
MADRLPDGLPVSIATRSDAAAGPEVPPTERPDDAAVPLDRLDAPGIARRMNREDARVAEAVGAEIEHIARAMELAADAIASGGRLIYLGAGTSGRLGVLDASECPPTFGVDPAVVMGIIAGGERALRCSIEGAEDDAAQARADLAGQAPGLGENDVVVGITASGTTPYVLAGLRAAQEQGAACVLICCNPAQRAAAADVTIAVDTGAEVLTGSTRLKAGTATKLVLNTLSTGAMALAGYVYEGRMVGMRPVNAKLEKRAVRIVAELAGVPADEAERLLKAARGRIATAVVMGRTGIACSEAERRLERAHGRLRRALEPDA